MEIGNQNHRRRGKSALSMVLLWEEEISDYCEKNEILSVSKFVFDGENEYIGRRLEGEM